MADYRDWARTLRRASFRGVPFFVESDSIETGRRLAVHEYPFRDDPYVEDMGRKASIITVSAYVATEQVEIAEATVRQACEQRGPGTLILPTAQFNVACEDCKREYNRDRQGYISFSLKFVRSGTNGLDLFSGILALARAVEFGAETIRPMLGEAFAVSYLVLGLPAYVASSASSLLQSYLGQFRAAVTTAPLVPLQLASILRDLGDAFDGADGLVLVGAKGDTYTASSFSGTAEESGDTGLVDLICKLFADAAAALPIEHRALFLRPWTVWEPDGDLAIGPRGAQIAANAIALRNLVRASALAQYAAAIVAFDYEDPRQARQARADLNEFFEYQISQLDGWANAALIAQLQDLRSNAVRHLTQLITNLAPVLTIGAPLRMPALYWANRLYGDASRAGELVARNRVKHGLFMPPEFEARSR